jgi:nucleotide-binding universal stress UspA family protein
MYRFKNIVFSPLAGCPNPAAARQVADLVARNEARLLLLGVADAPSWLQRLLSRPGFVDEVLQAEQARLDKTLRGWVERVSVNADIDGLLEEERSRRDASLAQLFESTLSPDEALEVHLLKGSPADVVPELVTKRRIDLWVIGTVARTGVGAMIMGNTAERILDNVNSSVIAVKPTGFVSPIKLVTP